MSLQTEIAIIKVRKRKDFLGIDLADEIINKILDAVEDQADSLGWVSIEAINKLRPEK